MLTKRLIACFDVIAGRVTKAQQFQDNVDVAPAETLAARLYADQIDEIVFYDITASAERRKIDLETVRRVARARVRPLHRGWRDPLGRRHVRGAEGGRGEDQRRLDGGAGSVDHPSRRRGVRASVHRAEHPGEAGGSPARDPQRLRGVHRRRPRRRPAATPSSGSGEGEDARRRRDRREQHRPGRDGERLRPRHHPGRGRRGQRPGDRVGWRGDVEHIAAGLIDGGAQAAIISSILYSPRMANVGVAELKRRTARGGGAGSARTSTA